MSVSTKSAPSRRRWALPLRILISLLLLYWLVQHSQRLGELSQVWTNIKSPWLIAALACALATVLLGGLRWWLLLRPVLPGLSLASTFRISLCASFFNIASFGTLGGDAWRVLAVKGQHPGTGMTATVSILVDHVVGAAATALLVMFVAALLLLSPAPVQHLTPVVSYTALVMILGAVLVVLALLTLTPGFVRRFSSSIPRPLRPFVHSASERMGRVLQHPLALVQALGVSAVMALSHFTIFYCALCALGLEVPALYVLLAMPVVDAAASLPISFSGLGVREQVFHSFMHWFLGLPMAISVAASLTGWACTAAVGLAGGLLILPSSKALLK